MKARCDRTGKLIDIKNGFFASPDHSGEWEFVSVDAPEKNDYSVSAGDFKSPEALVDRMGHLYKKTWFDAEKFVKFLHDFQAKNNIFNVV